ncbi:MAG: CotH kinase family protein, partial [Eubacteriales bacterium]|nr:CotH kinase family protein [Eubacteriales bacterium]
MNRLSAGHIVILLLAGILFAVMMIKIPDNIGKSSDDISQILSEDGESKDTAYISDVSSFSGTVQILSPEEIQPCVKNKSRRQICYGEIRMYGNPAAYDTKTDAFYIPVDIEGKEIPENSRLFLSDIQTNDVDKKLYFIDDVKFSDPLKAIEEGYLFQALLVEKSTYATFKMVFIGIPTIQLIYDVARNSDENSKEKSGTIIVTDPSDNTALEEYCIFHVRGHVTRNYSKKNYRVSLKDAQGDKINKSLLGMRSDDDWVLNALYTDQTRVREYVAYQIWKQVNSLCDTPVASSEI